jgi:hypothetical protein
LRPERTDTGVEGGALLLPLAGRRAFLFGMVLLGDVFMGGDPAAARQWQVSGKHDSSVACLNVSAVGVPRAYLVHDIFAVGVDVACKQTGRLAMLNELFERAAGLHDVRRQAVHFHVAAVDDGDAALRVEHVEAMRHVVERVRKPAIVHADAPVEVARDDKGKQAQDCDRQRMAAEDCQKIE